MPSTNDFNPDRLITSPRTLGEVYEKRGAIVTECCNMAIGPDCRFCPKCGYEARVHPASTAPRDAGEGSVDAALVELRAVRAIGAFTLHISADTRNLYFRLTIWPANPELSEFEVDGATLSEAIALAREFAKENQK